MIEPTKVITITDEEALGLIVRHGLTGHGVPATGEICFWSADADVAPGAVRPPWKLCKATLAQTPGWRADGEWIARTRV